MYILVVPRASVSFGHVVGETEKSYYENSRRVALGTRIGFMYKSKVN